MHQWLTDHPQILRNPRNRKETFYLNRKKNPESREYQQFFPLKCKSGLVVDGTTTYLSWPDVPQKAFYLVPEAKIVAVLRDPVERAISHYWHHVKKGREKRLLEDAFSAEILHGFIAGKLPDGLSWRYLNNGFYAVHLKCWLQYYPWASLKVVCAEDLFEQPELIVGEIFAFLHLEPISGSSYPAKNVGKKSVVSREVESRLTRFYENSVKDLSRMSLCPMKWKRYE